MFFVCFLFVFCLIFVVIFARNPLPLIEWNLNVGFLTEHRPTFAIGFETEPFYNFKWQKRIPREAQSF
jgi:hypothetical protein